MRWIGIAEVVVSVPQSKIMIIGESMIESGRQVIHVLR